jgi:hypothetical protein
MKKYFALLVLVALTFSNNASAAVSDGTMISQETMRPLASWVEKQMGVKMRSLPFATASGRLLKTSLGLRGAQQARSMAAYIPGRIIVNNIIWDADSVRAQSYLLHELVHHAQMLSGKKYPCHLAKEQEAYTLQNRWLAEMGEDEAVSDEWIASKSSCR